MPQAQAINRQLAYILEATYGTTPATPQTQLMEFVDFNFDLNAEEVQSRTLASHAQLTDVRRGNTSAQGSLSFELNPTNADTFLEAGLMGTWATDVLKIAKTFRSFSFEEGYSDLAQYRVMTGGVINSIGMTLSNSEYAQITCSLLGKAVSQWTSTALDTTPTPAVTGNKFFHDGGVFKIAGSTVGTMNSLSWTWDNGFNANFAYGSSAVASVTAAPVRTLKGKVGGQFESVTEMNKFISNTDSSVQYQLIAGSDSLDFKIGSLNYTNVTYSTDNGGVTWEADFTAKYNASDASTLVITRV